MPLKNLPHTADIVTLEEDEKLQKMLDRISLVLTERKQLFKECGVANLEQYETKRQITLPIVVTVLDSYDGLSTDDTRKEKIDGLLLQLLRDGASLGCYLIFTANRVGSLRMNMLSNISTKIALYLNDETEITSLVGRASLVPQAINGRGQVARGLKAAARLIEEEFFETIKEKRYASYKSGVGERIVMDQEDLESLTEYALVHDQIKNESSHLEWIKSRLNDYLV